MAKHVCTSDCLLLSVDEAAAFWRTDGEGIAREVALDELRRLRTSDLLPEGHTDGVRSDSAAAVKRSLCARRDLVHDIVDDTRVAFERRATKGDACRSGSPGLVHRIAQRRTWKLGRQAAVPALRAALPMRDGTTVVDIIWCTDDIEARVDARRALLKVRADLGALAPLDAEIIGHVIDGGELEEFADERGIPVGTIRSRLSRARRKLRLAANAAG